jgi:hypothetical protein
MSTTKVIENIPLVSSSQILDNIEEGDITLQVTDSKRSFSFKIVTKIPTTYILSNPRIKISTLRSGGIEQYTLDFPDYDIIVDGKKEYVFIANVTNGDPATSSRENLKYQFTDKQVYKITYIIDVYNPSPGGRLNKFEYNNRTFTYYENPITFNENHFDFDDNVSYGDKISIKGLALIYTDGDNTIPQSTNNANELIPDSDAAGKYILDGITVVDINGSTVVAGQLAPFVTPAIEFNFEDAEEDLLGTQNDDTTYTGVGELDAFYRPQVLKFDPTGNYLLPPNNLAIGKIYVVTVTAKWAGGYETSVTSKNHLYILPRPEITGVIKKPLYVDGGQQDVVSISVKKHTGTTISSPTKIWFNFYDPSNNLVAKAGGSEGVGLNNDNEENNYSFKLSELAIVGPHGLVNGVQYTVKAETRYNANNNLQRITQHRYSDGVPITFDLVNPTIYNVTPYDIQNDEGNANSIDQIVASIDVSTAAYYLYAPTVSNGIKFYIYEVIDNADDELVATTNSYDFVNVVNLNSYNTYSIKLSHIVMQFGKILVNGTKYNIIAEVTLTKHNGSSETRRSAPSGDETFSQLIVPVSSVTISNTWALATDNDPKSSPTHFNESLLIGVSGYFKKTAQFGSSYTKQLDVGTTKFRIEYQLDGSGNWFPAKRAVLGQRSSPSESIAVAVNRISKITHATDASGEYFNIPMTPKTVGTEQQEMVFYIPQDQNNDNNYNNFAFTELNTVKVRITIVDTANMWAPSPNTSSSRQSESIQLINKIESYNFVNGTSTEPWNNATDDSKLYVHVNNNVVEVPRSQIKAYSNDIIQELDEGFRIINTGVDTKGAIDGALPKVNIYFYGNQVPASNQNSSNSFTVSQINDMGAVIYQHASAKEYPYFTVYTTQTGSNDRGDFYKSRLLYAHAPQSSGDTTIDSSRVGLTLLYTGNDNPNFRPDIPSNRRVKYSLLNDGVLTNANTGYDNEFVNLVSLQTSSNASTSQEGNFNFTLSEAGLMTTSSVLSLLVMRFTKQQVLNIPVDWKSIHAHSVKVGYKYDSSHAYDYKIFNSPSTVPLYVEPTRGTTLHYSVEYIVTNTNLSGTTGGLIVEKNVPNKFFPKSSDYTVRNSTYKTFNTHGQSTILFDLSFNIDPENRMDGVNVYFTSLHAVTGSGINKVRIGSYTSAGPQTITLLQSIGGKLRVTGASGNSTIDSDKSWGSYDSANISFEAFRDARVNSFDASYNPVSNASQPVSSSFYVESGSQSTFGTSPNSNCNPILNVPVLTRPNEDTNDASGNIYKLYGGVINIDPSSNHIITWPIAKDENVVPFTYDIIVKKGVSEVQIDSSSNMTVNSYVLSIDPNTVDKYVIEIKKVFNGFGLGQKRERSAADVIVFHSVKVNTTGMTVKVENPSNDSSVTLSWKQAVISGNSITVSGSTIGHELANFANNIYAHHIRYRTSSSGNFLKLGASTDLIENSSPKLYTLPNTVLGTLYEFVMYVEAQVKYTLNNALSQTKSIPFAVPLTPITSESKYRVSTIPSVILPPTSLNDTTTVLVQGSQNPTLLLNLNANGLEEEGFVSVVVILTQDGTPAKPDGEQALLIFPDPNTLPVDASNNLFPNTVGTIGIGAGDARLAGGDTATSTPRNLTSSVLSTDPSNNTYTLTIGTPPELNGRYGLSRLRMPSTINSGFVDSLPVNYMVILTTRRGTDIGVGEFTYKSIPSVSNVSITTTNGQYYVNFNLSPA